MPLDIEKPFNDLPLIPPSGIEVDSKPILKKCIQARALLGEMKEAGKRIPNQSVLINAIPLLEAQASSEIENIVTTTDKLFQFSANEDQADPITKEALRYRTALRKGFDLIKERPLTTFVAEEVCSWIKGCDMRIRQVPGTKLANPSTQEVIYTPPEGEDLLRDKLKNWEIFLNTHTDLDPLIRMAMTHYQFEAIHPFTDGNGRTGRILNILFLIQEGLLEIPILYLSRYIIQNKLAYYQNLLQVTLNQQWETWILYILEAVIQTVKWTKEKIVGIKALMAKIKKQIKTKLPTIYSYELSELIFVQPYCRIQNLIDAGLAKRQTASIYLKQLTEQGILEEMKHGREKLYINPQFLRLLTT